MSKLKVEGVGREGLDSLLNMLTGRSVDPEHDAILTLTAKNTLSKLEKLSEGNKLALLYLTDMWTDILDGIKDKVQLDSPVLPNVLRVIAESIEERERLHKELHDKRQNTKESDRDTH